MATSKALMSALVTTVLLSHAAMANEAPLFAAPAAGNANGAAGSGSFGQVTLALAIVLAFVFVAAWAMRQLRKLNLSGSTQHLQVVSQVTLGTKERAVLIRVNDIHVLVGVAPGQVTALHTFTAPISAVTGTSLVGGEGAQTSAPAEAAVTAPTFQSLLKKSLGLSR